MKKSISCNLYLNYNWVLLYITYIVSKQYGYNTMGRKISSKLI